MSRCGIDEHATAVSASIPVGILSSHRSPSYCFLSTATHGVGVIVKDRDWVNAFQATEGALTMGAI